MLDSKAYQEIISYITTEMSVDESGSYKKELMKNSEAKVKEACEKLGITLPAEIKNFPVVFGSMDTMPIVLPENSASGQFVPNY